MKKKRIYLAGAAVLFIAIVLILLFSGGPTPNKNELTGTMGGPPYLKIGDRGYWFDFDYQAGNPGDIVGPINFPGAYLNCRVGSHTIHACDSVVIVGFDNNYPIVE